MEDEIRGAMLPIQCTTDNKGIPQTLVWSEGSADYIGRVNRHRKEVALMKVLFVVAPTTNTPWGAPAADRMRLAIGKAT